MLEKINMLREKLEQQLMIAAPYEEILRTSVEIDKLLVIYYREVTKVGKKELA